MLFIDLTIRAQQPSRKNIIKRIQNSHSKLALLFLNIQSNKRSQIRFSKPEDAIYFSKEILSHDMTQYEHINLY